LVSEVGWDKGLSPASNYKGKSKYGVMEASDAKQFKELKAEHGRPKRCPPVLARRTGL